jgi:hypothetical protein
VPVVIGDVDGLVNHARHESVDLFVLIVNNLTLNNMSCYSYNPQRIPELIAALKATRQAPIVVLCGDYYISSELMEGIHRAGADVFLWMPFSSEEFREVVRNVLSRRELTLIP